MSKIREITNILSSAFKIVYHLASSVQLMTWILLHIIVTYGTFSIIYVLVTTDVAVSVCGRSGLWPFRFVAVSVCGRSGLWPFRSVAIPVCGRFGFWPFRFVAVSVVAVSVCGRYDLLPLERPSLY